MAALCGIAALAACTPTARDDATRRAARAAVTPVIVNEYPGVPVQPAVDCLLDNATGPELRGLASDAITGPTAATRETVVRIGGRPETVRCFAGTAAPSLL